MNDLFFRCETCKRFVDAGCRWAYWTLVDAHIVQPDDWSQGGDSLPLVSADAVFAAGPYWAGTAEGPLLAEQLPRVREFLEDHREHRLSFGDLHRIHRPADEWLGWLCDDPDANLLPRQLVEGFGFSTWDEVEAYVTHRGSPPWWWSGSETRLAARQKFEELIQGVNRS